MDHIQHYFLKKKLLTNDVIMRWIYKYMSYSNILAYKYTEEDEDNSEYGDTLELVLLF